MTKAATTKRGQWKPGESGNPAGKPKGSGEIQKLRAALSDAVPEILSTLKAKALDGDVGAARLLLERVLPPLKAMEPVQVMNLPADTFTEQGRAVLAHVAAGCVFRRT